ncbi:MAG: hypothetical protein JWN22_2738 [Nocardioides sp.]|jgi:hypothetical protein|nr:hypothetical protein [Nocardioides sp.]
MAQRVVIHIGLMKSGTTFLQGRLGANREQLASQGVLFPGPTWRRQVDAVAEFMGGADRPAGSWEALREEINQHPGTAVVSMEYLAMLGPAGITRLAESFTSTDVRIVVGVRDLGRCVPAMWQEVVKNRQTWSWDHYVGSIRAREEGGKRFWRQQHAGQIVARWAEILSPEKVYVVTVPPPGAPAETLWDRFCEVADIGPENWLEAPRFNESLGAASTLVLRELNLRTGDLGLKEYKRRVKAVGKHLMPAHRGREEPIGFVVPGWLVQESTAIRSQIQRSGVHVVGHLDDLTPCNVPGVDPGTVEPAVLLEAAIAALEATLRQVERIRPRNP